MNALLFLSAIAVFVVLALAGMAHDDQIFGWASSKEASTKDR